MAIKTVRFNKLEERMLKKVLSYYKTDFSGCVKEMMMEKLEDLGDIATIQRLKEEKQANYLSSKQIDKLF